LGMKFVPVPITGPARSTSPSDAGGGPTGGQRVLFSVWDTRVQDYAVFATETKREWKKPDFEQEATHPAVNVSWDDAQAFCVWLTESERKAGKLGANEHYRLPSDHEWSCAVGIGEQEDAAKLPSEKNQKLADVFPWGGAWPPPQGAGNYAGGELQPALTAGKYAYIKEVLAGYDDGFVYTSPVGSFAANRFGLYDLGGNVWQWCEDWYRKEQTSRVLRGGAWDEGVRNALVSSCRTHRAPAGRFNLLGFRCVLAGSVATAAAPPAAAPTTADAPTMPTAAPAPAPVAPVVPTDPRLAQLAAGFKARHEADALQPFNTALAALNTSYVVNGVSRARTAAKAKGSLAEVTALDAEKTAIEQGRGVPAEDEADTPESLKTLRVTYRTAHAKFATERDAKAAPLYDLYLKALDAYIAELTQADKIDTARKVQVFRDDIALQKPGAGAAAPPATAKGTPSAPAPSAAPKPAVRAPKMNEHELATWVIASGGFVDVSFGTPAVSKTIAIASELPRGRFIITKLSVICDKVPGNDLSPLASAQDVGDLGLENNMLPDKTCVDLTPLRQMPKLGRLTIRDLDAAAVDVIASLTELSALFAGNMPEGSLEKIAKLKQLVAFESPAIIGPGIAALKSCKQLHSLTNGGNPAVSDEDIRLLAATLPDLDTLNSGASSSTTSKTIITNACIPSLLSLKSLSSLTLYSNELDDSVIEPLSKLPKLASLRVSSSKFIGSNLEVLKKFSSLHTLILDGCSVTDDALDVLVQIKGLTKLQFRDTKVTDAGIAKFKA
ncbi:MAG: SUMF1/EgtB/PvdO family nonheme iron enzyme, partial [Prosthecobacter sp.]|nr:SUMF1/EgtB/PvdO family nonheme iron enzyme [Prosthecobacter sp.]